MLVRTTHASIIVTEYFAFNNGTFLPFSSNLRVRFRLMILAQFIAFLPWVTEVSICFRCPIFFESKQYTIEI